MTDPIAVIVRFNGDPDDLCERFERARRRWTEAQDGDYSRPVFYAACKSEHGIVVVNGWETDGAHKAFAHQMRPHLDAMGWVGPITTSICGSRSWAGTEAPVAEIGLQAFGVQTPSGLVRDEPARSPGAARRRAALANTLGSSATRGEGLENLICAYLVGAVFLDRRALDPDGVVGPDTWPAHG